ncbi:unnamed protein product [Cyprideis torosa]|uniref:Methyltransferase FkbM domain-containing protein n=1 Tax=Cyprideis torosa TaxID=163714 RepID=A0A7R8ZLH9_9CRUS|nr:unnamed protein product [Cyprideis torosa]CAG0882300.1 unnamed protein product [Cyprideis torosa]
MYVQSDGSWILSVACSVRSLLLIVKYGKSKQTFGSDFGIGQRIGKPETSFSTKGTCLTNLSTTVVSGLQLRLTMAASTPPSSDEDPFSGRRIRFFVLDGLYRLSFLILLLLTISNCLSYFNKYVHMPTTSTMRLEQKTMADGPGFLLCRQPFFEWIKVKLTDNKTYWDEIDQDVFNDPEGYVSAMQRLYVAPIHSISSPALANETNDVVKPSPDQSEHEDEEEHHHQNIVNQDNSPSFENPGPMKTPGNPIKNPGPMKTPVYPFKNPGPMKLARRSNLRNEKVRRLGVTDTYFNKYVHMPTTSTMRLEQKTMADGPGFLLCRQPFFEWIKVKLTDNKTYWDEIDQDVFNDPEGYVSAMQRLYVAPIHSISSPALANETDDVVKPSPDQSEHEDEEEHHHQNIVNQDNSPSFENPGPMKTPDKHGEWSLRFARMQRRTSPCWLYRSQDIRIGTKSAKSLSFNFEDKDDPPDNRTTWHMYLISPTEYDFLDTLATTVSVKSKEQQTMIVKMKQEKYLKRQVQNGGGIDCENYDNFGYMKCVDDCVKTIALKRHRGEYSGRFGTWKQLCRIPGLYDYPELPECKKNVKKLDKLIRKYTELAQMILTNDPEIETVLQVWSYEAKDLISDLGGSTGIFLGASILSLVAYLKERLQNQDFVCYSFEMSKAVTRANMGLKICSGLTIVFFLLITSRFFTTCMTSEGLIALEPSFDLKSREATKPLLTLEEKPFVEEIRRTIIPPAPRNVPYNLGQPERHHFSEFSADGQYIQELFQSFSNGFFIEVGAYTGEDKSNSLWLERERNWTGILIEVHSANFEILQTKRRKAWLHHSCLSRKTAPEFLKFPKPKHLKWDATNGIYKMEKKDDHLVRWNSFELGVAFTCYPLHYYLLAVNQSKVDFLSLDVEGMDLDVLKAFPFDRFNVKALVAETGGIFGSMDIVPYLATQGYLPVHHFGLNTFFLKFGP